METSFLDVSFIAAIEQKIKKIRSTRALRNFRNIHNVYTEAVVQVSPVKMKFI